MKTSTIFSAYKMAETMKRHMISLRGRYFGGGEFGVLVGKDEYSLRYQKYDRQSLFFEQRLNKLFENKGTSLTRDDILKMEAGREMDMLIAVKVLGWKLDENTATSPTGSCNARNYRGHGDDWLDYYSTSIEAAWEVVEKMPKFRISKGLLDEWVVEWPDKLPYQNNVIIAPIAPLAICRAALLVMMEL
jgi:hypothetical protein